MRVRHGTAILYCAAAALTLGLPLISFMREHEMGIVVARGGQRQNQGHKIGAVLNPPGKPTRNFERGGGCGDYGVIVAADDVSFKDLLPKIGSVTQPSHGNPVGQRQYLP